MGVQEDVNRCVLMLVVVVVVVVVVKDDEQRKSRAENFFACRHWSAMGSKSIK